MIIHCSADGAKNRTGRSSIPLQAQDIFDDDIMLSGMGAESGDPVFDLECPLGELVQEKEDLARNFTTDYMREQFELVESKIQSVSWLKDGQPWLRRASENAMSRMGKFGYHLYQVADSDGGTYTCAPDYSAVPRHFTQLFNFFRSVSMPLNIIKSLPNTPPIITHPPQDVVALRETNVTFTCNRTATLSHQTTYWFKSCPFSSNSSCVQQFEEAIEGSNSNQNPLSSMQYMIRGHQADTLTITNVTEDSTGVYSCAVQNALGVDIRSATLKLVDQWLDDRQQAVISQKLEVLKKHRLEWVWFVLGAMAFVTVCILIFGFIYFMKLSILRDKKQQQQRQQQDTPLITPDSENCPTSRKESNLRQHLPNLGCPNIYNISKSADGFITGHLHQSVGHTMAQSICSNILDKEDPSISSTNSQQSDEASGSWGKSSCSRGDNCRNFYLHTSNTTATTVPMYDHPPSSNATLRNCRTMVRNSCVINPTYGFLRPENDAADWSFPRRNLERRDKIGEGQFGEVWRYVARQKDGKDDIVAVKQLKHRIGFGCRERLELIAEIEIMKLVNSHPNVIKLLHYCIDEFGPILLIMEYAEHGKLQTYLRNSRATSRQYGSIGDIQGSQPSTTSKELIKFTYHIARGMEYVASQGIVHRDLASRNILVSDEMVCKVADFGFARRVNEDCAYERTTTNPVPVKWMAPEALVENKFTSKSDVFSLGILMWEIVTLGATPYEQLSSESVYKKVTTGGRLERPAHCSDEFYNLMSMCWMQDPALRPTFKEVADELEQLLLSDNDYIMLDLYPEHAYYNIINTEEKKILSIGT